jgi:cytochrome c
MSRCTRALAALALALALPAAAERGFPGIGRSATPAEIAAWDIDVRPDFKGLPPGSGSVAKGQDIWEAKCASCHGTFAESNEVFAPIVGGTTAEDIRTGRVKALVTGDVARTTFMKVPTISSIWDYVNRAMPWNAPKSLSTNDVYAVVAYLLNLADIVPGDYVLSERNIAEVQQRMPNRNGMTRRHGLWDVAGKPDVRNVACMKDCPVELRVASSLPEEAFATHGNLSEQNRPVGPARGTDTSRRGATREAEPKVATVAAPNPMADLAKRRNCLTCHAHDRRIVGPSFQEIAAKYKADSGAEVRLAAKVRTGGGGAWGPVPMPPNADVTESEAKSLVGWILGGAR